MESLRFTTFNTALLHLSLLGGSVEHYSQRKPVILEELRKLETDVLCLQEVWKASDVAEFVDSLSDVYPYQHYDVQSQFLFSRNNGLMLLSKVPLQEVGLLHLDATGRNRGVLFASIDTENYERLNIACTHLTTDSRLPYLTRTNYNSWTEENAGQAQDIASYGNLDVVLGDFNSGPSYGDSIEAFSPGGYNAMIDGGFTSPYMEENPVLCTWCEENPIAGEEYGNLVIDHVFLNSTSLLAGAVMTTERVLYIDMTATNPWWRWWLPRVPREEVIKITDHAGVRLTLN